MIIEQEYDTEIEVEKYGKSLALHQDGKFITVQIDGALYAFQEQQKRIDNVLKAVEWHIEDCTIGEDTEYNKAWLEAMLFVKQELLK